MGASTEQGPLLPSRTRSRPRAHAIADLLRDRRLADPHLASTALTTPRNKPYYESDKHNTAL